MAFRPKDDVVLMQFKAALEQIFGNRLERAVLFGSRARGDARPDSDYDVAVFLTSLPDLWQEQIHLANLRVDFLDQTGVFFDGKLYPWSGYQERTPLMHEIRRDGVEL